MTLTVEDVTPYASTVALLLSTSLYLWAVIAQTGLSGFWMVVALVAGVAVVPLLTLGLTFCLVALIVLFYIPVVLVVPEIRAFLDSINPLS